MMKRRGLARTVIVFGLLTALYLLCTVEHITVLPERTSQRIPTSSGSRYRSALVSGYVYPGPSSEVECDEASYQAQILVQPSWSVTDDIQEIADGLENHPMVNYESQDQSLTRKQMVEKTWARMAHSSIWLEHYKVYLTVSRVIFFDKGVRRWPLISFLRGQIYDQNWVEQKNYVLQWRDNTHTFPKILEIPIDYSRGEPFAGPEDPRITIDMNDPHNPEPIIVFNMMPNATRKTSREMWMFKPFSIQTSMLKLKDRSNGDHVEKNWMPFFYTEDGATARTPGNPNPYIYFIYRMDQLQIIRCAVSDGTCYFVYIQDMPKDYNMDKIDALTGGTNLMSVDKAEGPAQSFIGFPRTHLNNNCKDGFYRPQIMILKSSSTSDWHIEYLSDSLDFDETHLQYSGKEDDPCGGGRVMIVNSIARWERHRQGDILTLTFSVDDGTTQNMRLRGVAAYINGMNRAAASLQTEALRRASGHIILPRPEAKLTVSECAQQAASDFERADFKKMQEARKQGV